MKMEMPILDHYLKEKSMELALILQVSIGMKENEKKIK